MGTVFRNPNWLVPNNANKTNKANYSLDFDASSNNYIEISENILSGLASFSISVWYNANTLSGDRAILGAWSDGVTQMLLYWDDPNGWRFIMNNGTNSYDVTWGTSTTINTWNNIVVTYDGSTIKFYHNNGTPATDPATGSIMTQTVPWKIGVDTNGTKHWDGKLSQFCLFNYALSPSDISKLYGDAANGVGDPLSLTTPPVAYYPLSDELIYNGSSFLVPNMVGSNVGSSNFLCTEFDGVNDNVDVTSYLKWKTTMNNSAHVVVEDDWVVSYWMKSSNIGGLRNVTGGGGFFQYSNTFLNGALRFYNGSWVDVQGSANLGDNQWHHVAIQCEGGTTHRCYIDGLQTYENTGSAFPSAGLISYIGSYAGGTQRFYEGKLSQLAMFDASNVSISDLYNGGVQPNIRNFNNLIFLADLGKDAELLNNALQYYDVINEAFYPSNNFSWEALKGDSPNGSSVSGVGVSIPVTALKSEGPYSSNNIISGNSDGFSQLVPFGARQAAVADTSKMNVLVQPGLYETGGLTCRFIAQGVVSGATIDWGDGSGEQTLLNGNNDHTYSIKGIYNVKVGGTFGPKINSSGYGLNFINITHFGDDVVHPTMYLGWRLCANLDITAYDTPTISNNGQIGYCFQRNHRLVNANGSVGNWDVSNINSSWPAVFQDCSRFNVDISKWTPPSSVNLGSFLRDAKSFNRPIGTWNTSVTDLTSTLQGAKKFNQPLTNWTLPASLSQTFRNATSFNSFPGTPSGTFTNLYYAFQGADAFNQDITSWDVSGVTNFTACFQGADAFNQPIGSWTINTTPGANVNMEGMFYTTPAFNQNISSWDMSEVSKVSQFGAYNYGNGFPAPGITTDKITSLQFVSRKTDSNSSWFTSIDWSNVTTIYYAFEGNDTLNQDFGDVDISSLTNATAAFSGNDAFNTSNVTSTLTKWAIKVYNGNGNTGVNATSIFSGRTFDNSQTSDTGGTSFPFPTSFSLSIGGSPDLTGGGDYCKVVDVSGDNQLEGKDMYCSSTAGTDYVELLTNQISGSGSDVSITIPYYWNHNPSIASTTGLTADYKIDGGSWTNFINDTTSSGSGSSSGSNASPIEGLVENLSFSTSFQVRLRIQTGQATANTCNVKSITITDNGNNIYVEDFSTQLGVGYDDGLTPPSAAWSDAGDALDWLSSSTEGNWTGITTGLTRIN